LPQDGNVEASDRLAEASVVDDLDGDRTQDVLTWDMDQTQTTSGTWYDDTTVGVLSGGRGRRLWSVEKAGIYTDLIPIPARVGPRATPGLLLLTLHGDTGTVEVSALTGTGRMLWDETPTTPGVPATVVVRDVLTDRRGPVQLLVSWFTGVNPGGSINRVTSDVGTGALQLGLLDGADGAVTSLGSPVPTPVSMPRVFAVADLDGDGRDDALVAVAAPKDGVLQAVSTRTGSVLWKTSGLDLGDDAYVEGPAQDAVGDRRPDILLRTAVWSPPTLPTDQPPGQTCTVLDGSTGAPSGSVHLPPYGECWLNGDSDGDARADLLTWDVTTASPSVLRARAWSPAHAHQVWSRQVTLSGPVQQPEDVTGWLSAYGDLQPDGSQELGYALANSRSGASVAGVLDGRSGRALFGRDMMPLASLDGRGDELMKVVSDLGIVWHFTTFEGRTRRAGATYRVRTRDGAYLLDATLLRGPSRCSRNLLFVGSALSQSGPVAAVVELVDLGSGKIRYAEDLNGSSVKPYPVSRSGTELAC
jgi:hypothetical protein